MNFSERNVLDNYGDALTVKDILAILPIGKNSVYKLLQERKIKSINVGRKIIIPKSCLYDYLHSVN